jgi:tetratricopeptide (TPR) repeat protein
VHWIASIGYPLSFVFGFATVWFHDHFLTGRRWGQYAGAASMGLAILTHPASISILPFCFYISWRRTGSFSEAMKMSWQIGAISFLCVALCYGLYPQAMQVAAVDTSLDFGSVVETLTWYLSRLILAPHWLWVDLHPQPVMWELVVGAVGYVGLFYLWWRGPEPIRIFAVWTVIAILPFFNAKPGFRWTPAGPSRHLYFSAIGTSFIFAYFIIWAGENLKFWIGYRKASGVLVCAGIVCISIYNNWHTQAISYYASGRTYFAQAKIDLGIMQFQKAINISPEVVPPDTYLRLTLMFFSYNRSPESFLRIGRDLYPDNVNLMFLEGFWESQQTDLEVQKIGQRKIARAFELAVNDQRLKLNAAVACHNFGGYVNNQGDFDRAISLFRQALVFDPQYLSAAFSLGLALRNAENNDEALGAFQKVIELDSEHEDAYIHISEILIEKGRFEGAVQVAELILRFSPKSINAHYLLATALQAQGNVEKAVQYYTKVLELAPEHAGAKQALQLP